MQERKTLQLGGMLELTTGELYEQQAIDGIKDELQALHGVKLEKHQTDYHIYLLCKNAEAPHFCGYCVKWSIQFRINRPNKGILLLQSFGTEHRFGCRDVEEANFLRIKNILNQKYEAIHRVIRRRQEKGLTIKNPTHCLEILCEEQGLDKQFLYQGLADIELRRRIKKKFDNILAEARRKCKQCPFSSEEKTKQDEELSEMLLDGNSPVDSIIHEKRKEKELFSGSTSKKGQDEWKTTLFKPLNKKIKKINK